MNSTTGRARGTRSRTQNAVGHAGARLLTMIVMTADDERVDEARQKPAGSGEDVGVRLEDGGAPARRAACRARR